MNMRGTTIRLSNLRGLTRDVLRAAARTPTIPLQRRMNLARLVKARDAAAVPLSWSAIFVKAYALVAQETAVLRQVYLAFPIARLYEYPDSVAAIFVRRAYGCEDALFALMMGRPAALPLAEIAARIDRGKTAEVEQITEFRRALRFAALPTLARRLAIWVGLNLGRHRSRFFGTFGVSTVGASGADLLTVIWPAGTVLTYGPIADNGVVDVSIIFDHRICDAAVVAQALGRLETTLNGAVADELIENSASRAAATSAAKIAP
jgi:hypothetical protein